MNRRNNMMPRRSRGSGLKVALVALCIACSFGGGVGVAYLTSGNNAALQESSSAQEDQAAKQKAEQEEAAKQAAAQAEAEKQRAAAEEAAKKAAEAEAAKQKAAQEEAAKQAAAQAEAEKQKAAQDAEKQTAKPAQPKGVLVRNTDWGVEVTWQASTGASGYQVMRKAAKGSWEPLGQGKIDSPTTTSYTDASAKNAEYYAYAVKATSSAGESAYDDKGAGLVCLQKPAFTKATVVSKTSIRLHWNAQPNVDGYRLYCKSASGASKLVKKITDEKQFRYLVEKLSYGTAYEFELKSYAKYKGTEYTSPGFVIGKTLKVNKKRVNGLLHYYDEDGQMLTDVRKFMKKKAKYLLKVNVKECVVTVFAADGNGEFSIPVKAWVCSPGADGSTKPGTWKLGSSFRWRVLFHNSFSQWGAVIHKDILFHTSPYNSYQNKKDLDVKEYNKLGTPCSYGCVRMQCEAVKWIHDTCPKGTKVVIYSNEDAGPFGKPVAEKLPKWHTWDPTDPTCKKLCVKRGCHHDVTQ